MKTHSLKLDSRIWTSRCVALGLGLSALTSFAAAPASQTPNDQGGTSPGDIAQNWEDQIATRMQHIQQEMDNLFRDSVNDFDSADKTFWSGPKFDASATVQDRGDNYVATFYLPKRDLSNVKVTVTGDTLTVNATAEENTRSNPADKDTPATETEMLNQYEQLVTLPGPVDSGKMKVDKIGDSIVVTLPKKGDKTVSAR